MNLLEQRPRSAPRRTIVLVAVLGVTAPIGCGARSNLRLLEDDVAAVPSNGAGGWFGSGVGGGFDPGAGGGGADRGSGGSPNGSGGNPFSCLTDEVRCGLECVRLAENQNHCGACDRACAQDELCIEGTCQCVAFARRLTAVSPPNGQSSVEEGTDVAARFNCSVRDLTASSESARLYGSSSGWISADYPASEVPFEILLRPRPRPERVRAYFPGEIVTAWIGEPLAGPYLWQFRSAVAETSPGMFVQAVDPPETTKYTYASALGDLDGDGDLDLWLGASDELRYFENEGGGGFSPLLVLDHPALGIALGDLDRDGILEVATTNSFGGMSEPEGRIFVRQGTTYAARAGTTACSVFGDLNGDGFLDCLSTGHYSVVDGEYQVDGKVFFNDGTGAFVEGATAEFGFSCELGDLNNDGSLDAACISPVVAPVYILLNDGQGGFTRMDQELGEAGARDVGLGDIDADGDMDVLVSHWFGGGKYAENMIFLNDGQAHFEGSTHFGRDGGDFQLGDIDGDGDLDVLVSILPPYSVSPPAEAHPVALYRNDGQGSFQKGTATLGSPAFHRMAVGDLDGDRDLDAVVNHSISGSVWSEVWMNQE